MQTQQQNVFNRRNESRDARGDYFNREGLALEKRKLGILEGENALFSQSEYGRPQAAAQQMQVPQGATLQQQTPQVPNFVGPKGVKLPFSEDNLAMMQDLPRQEAQFQSQLAATGQAEAPEVGVEAKKILTQVEEYRRLSEASFARAQRNMPFGANKMVKGRIDQDLAVAKNYADKAEKLEARLEKAPDVKDMPISDKQQQPHQYDPTVGKWIPVPGSKPRPIFNPKPLVQIDMAGNEYQKKFGGGIAEDDLAVRSNAVTASEGIEKLDDLIAHLETSDAITGLGSDVLKNVERVKTLLMADVKAGKQVSDTELLNAFLGSDVFPMIKALGIGARGLDTPAEREFLREVMSGTTAMNKETLTKMAKIRRNIAVRATEKWNARLKQIPGEALEGVGITRDPIRIPEYRGSTKPTSQEGKPKKIMGDADYERLPSGTQFIGPDGVLRVKP
jgi:hypothetical protein